MSRKQNKKLAQSKAKRNEYNNMEKHLLETTFPLEVEGLPLEELTKEEQYLCEKCRNHEELTYKEFNELKQLLGKYRKTIKENNPNETIENLNKTVKIIKSEKELLNLLDNQENYKLQMKYRIGRKDFILNLKVNPIINNSQYVSDLSSHLNLFKQLNNNERILLDKSVRNAPLSEEENKMLTHINKKLEDKILVINDDNFQNMSEFLARQVEFEEASLTTFKEKVKFWNRIDISSRTSLYNKVRDMLGLTETRDDDLFLDVR